MSLYRVYANDQVLDKSMQVLSQIGAESFSSHVFFSQGLKEFCFRMSFMSGARVMYPAERILEFCAEFLRVSEENADSMNSDFVEWAEGSEEDFAEFGDLIKGWRSSFLSLQEIAQACQTVVMEGR